MTTPKFITINGSWLDFDQIVHDLELRLSLPDKKALAKTAKTDLHKYHHGMGTWIRNNYDLWGGNPLTEQWRNNPASHLIDPLTGTDCSPDHPDALSMRIIEEVWSRLQYINP